jgi:hypothetical protein
MEAFVAPGAILAAAALARLLRSQNTTPATATALAALAIATAVTATAYLTVGLNRVRTIVNYPATVYADFKATNFTVCPELALAAASAASNYTFDDIEVVDTPPWPAIALTVVLALTVAADGYAHHRALTGAFLFGFAVLTAAAFAAAALLTKTACDFVEVPPSIEFVFTEDSATPHPFIDAFVSSCSEAPTPQVARHITPGALASELATLNTSCDVVFSTALATAILAAAAAFAASL